VGEAFFWGAVGASALLIGSLISYTFNPSQRAIAVVMALGTGILIGSVSFELIDDALDTQSVAWVSALTLVGAGVFAVGNWVIDRRGGSERKDPTGNSPKERRSPSCWAPCSTGSPSPLSSASRSFREP
jgi:zinc transporter, ZIP family